jgi:hypothetical protein
MTSFPTKMSRSTSIYYDDGSAHHPHPQEGKIKTRRDNTKDKINTRGQDMARQDKDDRTKTKMKAKTRRDKANETRQGEKGPSGPYLSLLNSAAPCGWCVVSEQEHGRPFYPERK